MASLQNLALNRLVVDLTQEAAEAPKEARKVVQDFSQRIKDTAKMLAPVDTGATRDSITYETSEKEGGEIGPSTRQAIFLEYGTSKMAPRAFMGPALDRHTADFEKAIADAVTRNL